MTVQHFERSKNVSCCLNSNNCLCLRVPTTDFNSLQVYRMDIPLGSDSGSVLWHTINKWLMGWAIKDPMTEVALELLLSSTQDQV